MQCIEMTLKGRRCKNITKDSDVCWVHINRIQTRPQTRPPSQPKHLEFFCRLNDFLFIHVHNKLISSIFNAIPEMLKKHKLSQITRCNCCYDDQVPNNQLICCSNVSCENHFACVDCIRGYVDANIQTGSSLKCMFGCDGVYDKDTIRMALPFETFTKFCDALEIKEVAEIANVLSNYQICPFCSRYGCVIDFLQQVKCEKCYNIWCSKCRRRTHQGDCYKVVFANTDNITERCLTIDRMLQEISTTAMAHSCPSCGVKFYKDEGCNHMKCPRCGTSSCYLCGVSIKPLTFQDPTGLRQISNYYHFKGNIFATADSTCELYNINGDAKYNDIRILKAIDNFIEKNSKETRMIIYDRLVKMDPTNKVLLQTIRTKYKIKDEICSIC